MAETIEIEKRWLLLDAIGFSQLEGWKKLEITQVYLENHNKESERIRMSREEGANIVYTHTIKRPAKVGQYEAEEEISESKFVELMSRANLKHQTILKTRYVKEIDEFKFEVDCFIHPIVFRVLEVEIESMDVKVKVPEFLGRRIEITGDKSLSNFNLSLKPKAAKKSISKYLETFLEKEKKKLKSVV